MQALGPFEPQPHLAVGVSGGADSLCLAGLALDWARAQGGRLTALTVDHRLRADSAREAALVQSWAARAGADHVILPWTTEKPATGLQAAARDARYRLLVGWCRAQGVLHLLLGHHAGDQAETLLLRLVRGSGRHGLAAMAPLLEQADVRLLRPLLQIDGDLLRAHLRRRGEAWLEDPSNGDPRFGRVRMRRLSSALAAAGLDTHTLLAAQATFAGARAADENDVAALAARACRWYPEGYASIERSALDRRAPATALLVGRVLAAVGGRSRPPPAAAVTRVLRRLLAGEGDSPAVTGCGRCCLQADRRRIVITRERRLLPAPISLDELGGEAWDGRFRLRLAGPGASALAGCAVRPIVPDDLRVSGAAVARRLPARALASLPVLIDGRGVAAIPHLGYVRPDLDLLPSPPVEAVWQPRLAITGPGCFMIP